MGKTEGRSTKLNAEKAGKGTRDKARQTRKDKGEIQSSVWKDVPRRRQAEVRERKMRTERRKEQMIKQNWECGRGRRGSYPSDLNFHHNR